MNNNLYSVHPAETIRELFLHAVEQHADSPAFRRKRPGGEIFDTSYRAFYEDVAALSTALLRRSLGGRNIAVMGENRYEWAVSYMAVACGVGTVVPIDKELSPEEMANILASAGCSAVLYSGDYRDKILGHTEGLPQSPLLIDIDLDRDDGDILSYAGLLHEGRGLLAGGDNSFRDRVVGPGQDAAILFTSGTTGMTKGVVLTQRNIASNVVSVLSTVRIGPSDVLLSVLPLHHTYECTIGQLCALYAGACIAHCEGLKFIAQNFKEYRPTVLVAVPLLLENVHRKIMKKIATQKGGTAKLSAGKILAMARGILGEEDARRKVFHEIHEQFGGMLRLIVVGAAAIDPGVMRDYLSFGFKVLIGYGLTECAPLVLGNNDQLVTTDTVGIPIPGVEVRVDTPDGKSPGELLVKGPNVMRGYWNNPEATAASFTEDGWLRTGDIVEVTPQGNYKVVGRIKNIIVTKTGKNIYPEEIEHYINQSPYVKESLVIGQDRQNGDTEVSAHIFPDFDRIKEKLGDSWDSATHGLDEARRLIADAISAINLKLPNYKSVRSFIIRDHDFERNTSQKVKRYIEVENIRRAEAAEAEQPEAEPVEHPR